MIYVEDQLVKVNGVVLPGLVKSIEVKESAKIDEQEVEGSATKPKQATGYNSTIEKIWTGRSSLSISFIFPAYSEMGGIRFERHGHRGSTAWTGQHGKLYPSVPFFSERALHLFVRYRRSAAY